MSKRKILWVVPKWTFPVDDGARVATDRLIRNFSNEKFSIDVLCLDRVFNDFSKEEMLKRWPVKNVFWVQRKFPLQKRAKLIFYILKFLRHPFKPLTFSTFFDKKLKNEIEKKLNISSYKYVFFDGLHLAACFDYSKTQSKVKYIYRAHNIEADLWFRSSEIAKNVFMKLFYLFQAKLVEKFEKNVICHVTGVFCISDTDKVFIQKQYKVKNIEFVPLGLNFTEETKFSDQLTTKFLFIGKLDWPPNKDGLMWFLDNVWNQLIQLRDDIQLVIVGGGDSAWLKNKLPIKGVDFRGRVEEVQSVYDEIDFALIPIFYGSGTRIKVLEAVSKQKPIISTEMGVMGSNLLSDHFLSAQTQNEWIDCLAKAQLNQEMINMAQKAHAYLEKDFDEKRVSQKLEDFLLSF